MSSLSKLRTVLRTGFLAAASLLLSAGIARADVISFGIDTSGGGAFQTIDSITWSNSNAVAVDALPITAAGETFFTYYTAQFSSGSLSTSLVAVSDPSIRVYAGFREVVVDVAGSTATFQVQDDPDNFIYIYDGSTLILSATPLSGAASQSSYDASGPALNKGMFNIVAQVDFYDTDYFSFGIDAAYLSLISAGTAQVPFGNPNNVSNHRDIDGNPIAAVNGDDLVFGVTGNTQFTESERQIPEPGTAMILSMAVVGLAARRTPRRRR